jgi:hypothetical protein
MHFIFTLFLTILILPIFTLASELNSFVTKAIEKEKLTIVVTPDYWYLSAELKAYYQELLHAYLIEDGNTIIERKRLQDIFSEKALNQSGAADQNDNTYLLKDAGNLLGADVLLIFSTWIGMKENDKVETHSIGFRLVDCRTGSVMLSGHVDQDSPIHSARLICYSLRAARTSDGWIRGDHKTYDVEDKSIVYKKALENDHYIFRARPIIRKTNSF